MMATRMLLLLLYFILDSSAHQYNIDWDRCTKDMKCYVRESCIEAKTAPESKKILAAYTQENLKDGCDAIMQIKSYSKNKFQVHIQINASAITSGTFDDRVTFTQDTPQFKCDKTSVTSENSNFEIKRLDTRLEGKTLFCAFTAKSTKEIPSLFDTSDDKFPTLEFANEKIKYATDSNIFWALSINHANCDPEMISSPDDFDSTYIFNELAHFGPPPLTCGSSKILRIKPEGASEPVFLDEGVGLECAINWKYKLGTNSFRITKKFTAYCVEKYCSLCKPLEEIICSGCSPYVPGNDTEHCNTAVCPDNQWILNDGKLFKGEMECKRETEDINSKASFWYLKDGSIPGKVTKAACVKMDTCWTSANVKDLNATGKCLPDIECLPLTKSANNLQLSCPDGLPLSYIPPSGTVSETAQFTCDFTTGTYKDGPKELAKDSKIYCGKKKVVEEPEKVAPASFLSANLPYLAAGGGVLLLLIIAVIVIVVVVRKKKEKQVPRTINLFSAENPSRGDSVKSLAPSLAVSAAEPGPPPTNSELPRLPSGPKGPFLQRERNKKPVLHCDRQLWEKYDDKKYNTKMLPRINQYDTDGQRYIFLMCTSFGYMAEKREDVRPYGYLRQFFELISHSYATQNDCHFTWDRIFRFVRLMEAVITRRTPKDPKCTSLKLIERMRTILINCAKPIFAELGWNMMPNEDPKDTMMRFWAVRVMLWADQLEVHAELTRLAALPFEQLESPMRAVVLLYQTRNQNRGEEMKDKHWPTVVADPKNPEKDKFGTTRQHLLFGLAATRDEKKAGTPGEFQVMRDVFNALYDVDTIFSTADHLWAVSGATEYFSNTKTLVDLIVKTSEVFVGAEWMAAQIKKLTQGKEYEEGRKIRLQYLEPFIDWCDKVAESCWTKKQYKEFGDCVGSWEDPFAEGMEVPPGHASCDYELRHANLDLFCADKKFAEHFDEGLKRFEQN